jgi:very-short-patch-repair endonuclease
LATELAYLFGSELGDHKIVTSERIHDADIIIRSHKLVVEYDGSYWHQNKVQKDKEKIAKLRSAGWKVIRVREAPLKKLQRHDVLTTDREPLHEVVAKIIEAAESLGIKALQSSSQYRSRGLLITADNAEQRIMEILQTPQSESARSAQARWYAFFNELVEFGKKHHHYEPQAITDLSQQKLCRWVRTQRRDYKLGRIFPERVVALESLNSWTWEEYDALWEKRFRELKIHQDLNKSVSIQISKNSQKESLRNWVINQRIAKRRGRLSSTRAARLESFASWSWDPLDEQWQDAFQLLLNYVGRVGSSDVKQDHVEDGFKLGVWLNKQRGRYRRGDLPQDRVTLLEGLPLWTWEPREHRASNAIVALGAFTSRMGHSKVPIRHVESGFKLGEFVYNVRGRYSRGELSEFLKTQLELVPHWTWTR